MWYWLVPCCHEFVDEKGEEASVLRFLGRHLVALCVTFREKDKPDERPIFRAYAGTLIYIEGRNFFLTAGHILSELRDVLQDDRIEVLNAVLGDTFGPAPKSKIPIPFVLKREDMFFIDDDDEGLDFGVVMLNSYYVGLLAANGSVALVEENWIHQHKICFDGYLMLGLPAEYTSDRVNADGEGSVSATLISVARLEKPPEGITETRHPRFVGQLGANFPLQSVRGRVAGLSWDLTLKNLSDIGSLRFKALGFAHRRLAFACPLPTLASLMTGWARAE